MTLPSSFSLTVDDAVVYAAYHNDEDAMKVFKFLGSQPANPAVSEEMVGEERPFDMRCVMDALVRAKLALEGRYDTQYAMASIDAAIGEARRAFPAPAKLGEEKR